MSLPANKETLMLCEIFALPAPIRKHKHFKAVDWRKKMLTAPELDANSRNSVNRSEHAELRDR